jgi:hypothetical protein
VANHADETYEAKRDMAVKVARKMFAHRGNHSEIHLREDELSAIIQESLRLYEKFLLMCDEHTLSEVK